MKLHSLKPRTGPSSAVEGIFSTPIPYEIRNPSGDWSPYFGTFESQKHDDLDTDCCWAYSGNECLEDQLMFLWKTEKFTNDDISWFQTNGYIDSDNDFYLSRRFIPILSGVTDNGNDQVNFWELSEQYGAIPNSLLPFTNNTEYFDRSKITQAMLDLGVQFLERVKIAHEEVGTRFQPKTLAQLKEALLQSPLQIGIPIPQDVQLWNSADIKYDGSTEARHSVELYKIDDLNNPNFPDCTYDQYEPKLKNLSGDYFIPLVTKAVVTAVNAPVGPQTTVPTGVLVQALMILKKIGLQGSWIDNLINALSKYFARDMICAYQLSEK